MSKQANFSEHLQCRGTLASPLLGPSDATENKTSLTRASCDYVGFLTVLSKTPTTHARNRFSPTLVESEAKSLLKAPAFTSPPPPPTHGAPQETPRHVSRSRAPNHAQRKLQLQDHTASASLHTLSSPGLLNTHTRSRTTQTTFHHSTSSFTIPLPQSTATTLLKHPSTASDHQCKIAPSGSTFTHQPPNGPQTHTLHHKLGSYTTQPPGDVPNLGKRQTKQIKNPS